MSEAYLPAIANHLWQSTLLAGVAGLLTLVLGNNRARVRHAAWLAASCKFLIPVSCHVRYRDNLVAAIHMFVETIFWFHPLVWWMG